VYFSISALSASRCFERSAAVWYSGRCASSTASAALQNRAHIFEPVEAMLMYPSAV
jgi:hypothetical protein